MKATVTEASATEKVLDIEGPRERFDALFEDKVKKYAKQVKMNGFRPGHVPKQLVAARFQGPIRAEALEALVDEVVKKACEENDIKPVGPGRVEKLENEDGKPIVLQAVMEIDPPVELKDYKYSIPVNAEAVTDAVVEEEIKRVQERLAETNKVDRPAQTGDTVFCKYERIEIEGEEQPLPQYPEFRVEMGKGLIPELDAGLVGVSAGETKDISFNFPKDYPQPALAGKPSAYRLAIQEVQEVIPPALDDEFAKKLGHDSLDAFRAFVKEKLDERNRDMAKDQAYGEAVKRLVEAHPVAVPKARIQNYVESKLKEQGHVHAEGEDHGHDHSDLEQEAEFQIRRFRILDAIATKEAVKATQEEVDARVKSLAERYGTDFETLKTQLRRNGRIQDVREELRLQKTLDLVIGAGA